MCTCFHNVCMLPCHGTDVSAVAFTYSSEFARAISAYRTTGVEPLLDVLIPTPSRNCHPWALCAVALGHHCLGDFNPLRSLISDPLGHCAFGPCRRRLKQPPLWKWIRGEFREWHDGAFPEDRPCEANLPRELWHASECHPIHPQLCNFYRALAN